MSVASRARHVKKPSPTSRRYYPGPYVHHIRSKGYPGNAPTKLEAGVFGGSVKTEEMLKSGKAAGAKCHRLIHFLPLWKQRRFRTEEAFHQFSVEARASRQRKVA